MKYTVSEEYLRNDVLNLKNDEPFGLEAEVGVEMLKEALKNISILT